MSDDDAGKLVIDDEGESEETATAAATTNCSSSSFAAENAPKNADLASPQQQQQQQKGGKNALNELHHHHRHHHKSDKSYRHASASPSSSSSSASTSTSSSSSGSSSSSSASSRHHPNEKQQQQQHATTASSEPSRKRKKEAGGAAAAAAGKPGRPPLNNHREEQQTPKRSESAAAAVAEELATTANKKRKTEKPKTTATKHCQTDDLSQQPLKPDTNVLLDITIIFAPDPNTLYFTTKWKGRVYHGVITDGLSPKNQLFAVKRERAERLNGGGKGAFAQNGQSPALKQRGKRGTLARTTALDRKGRPTAEDFSIFDLPEETTTNDENNKSAKMVKVEDGEAQRMFTRCPHKQCGHVFETVNEVNHHMLFRHVNEPAVMKESSACQYTAVATSSTGSDPIPELASATLCTRCREPLAPTSRLNRQPNDQQLKVPTSTKSPSQFSDISDDAPPVPIKEESIDKPPREENRSNTGLNFGGGGSAGKPHPASANPSLASNSSTSRNLGSSLTNNKAASNSSTPAPSTSTPLSAKQPKRSAITPNMGSSSSSGGGGMNNPAQQQQQQHPNMGPRMMLPPPGAGFPPFFGHPGQLTPQQQQQFAHNQQMNAILSMLNASGHQLAGIPPPTGQPIKAGGSITAGSSAAFGGAGGASTSSAAGTSSSAATTAPTLPGGLGIVHPHPLGALAAANGLPQNHHQQQASTSSGNTPGQAASTSGNNSSGEMRHKIHELKSADSQQQQAEGLLGISQANMQQRVNASPNPANVITSTTNAQQQQQHQRGQQQMPFVRPPNTSLPQFPFLPHGLAHPQQALMNQQYMNRFTAAMFGNPGIGAANQQAQQQQLMPQQQPK